MAARGGWSTWIGDRYAEFGPGYHGGITLDIAADSLNGFGLDATYHAMGESSEERVEFGGPVTLRNTPEILEATLFFRHDLFVMRGGHAPYFKAGVGYEWMTSNVEAIRVGSTHRAEQSSGHFGISMGMGISLHTAAKTGLRVEGLIHLVEDGQALSPDASFATVGLSWWFAIGR